MIVTFVTFDEYKSLGYTVITDATAFTRFETMAESIIDKEIFNRPYISELDTPSGYNNGDPVKWSERNKRGICELVDLLYNNIQQENRLITSFNNGTYSESYATYEKTVKSIDEQTADILKIYYTSAQTYRGI